VVEQAQVELLLAAVDPATQLGEAEEVIQEYL
jgi:hypothetical protein